MSEKLHLIVILTGPAHYSNEHSEPGLVTCYNSVHVPMVQRVSITMHVIGMTQSLVE